MAAFKRINGASTDEYSSTSAVHVVERSGVGFSYVRPVVDITFVLTTVY